MTVRIICDSSCNVPNRYAQSLRIIQVPAWINFADGSSHRNGVDITEAEFYQRLTHEKRLPTTSQPTPQDFIEAIAGCDEEEIVLAAVSSKMSGTHNSQIQAVELLPERRIFTHDTLSASVGSGWQVVAGAEAAAQGANAQEVIAAMQSASAKIFTGFTIDTLKYLAASGRAPALQAMLGNLLDIRPLMKIEDGTLHVVGRVRGRKKSKRELIDLVAAQVGEARVRVAIANANASDEAIALGEDVKAQLNASEVLVIEIGPVLGALAGPGTLAVAAFKQD